MSFFNGLELQGAGFNPTNMQTFNPCPQPTLIGASGQAGRGMGFDIGSIFGGLGTAVSSIFGGGGSNNSQTAQLQAMIAQEQQSQQTNTYLLLGGLAALGVIIFLTRRQ